MSEHSFTLPAYAKINLALRVLGRRPDGYHEIRTIFQTVSLADSLTFESLSSDTIELSCSDSDLPTGAGNLVYRAALALRERFGIKLGARIFLDKRIPAQGGLGGGSADAAIALIGLAHLWQVETNLKELSKVGAGLGADVPFFLTGGTALGTGTGAEIAPLEDVQKMHLVIVSPSVRVSTAEAYKALNAPALTKAECADTLSVSHAEALFAGSLREVMHNDFESVVMRLQPEIGRAREALIKAGANGAILSGSGSSVFGVFDSKGEAERAARALSLEVAGRVFPCVTLTRAEYVRALGQCAAVLR